MPEIDTNQPQKPESKPIYPATKAQIIHLIIYGVFATIVTAVFIYFLCVGIDLRYQLDHPQTDGDSAQALGLGIGLAFLVVIFMMWAIILAVANIVPFVIGMIRWHKYPVRWLKRCYIAGSIFYGTMIIASFIPFLILIIN